MERVGEEGGGRSRENCATRTIRANVLRCCEHVHLSECMDCTRPGECGCGALMRRCWFTRFNRPLWQVLRLSKSRICVNGEHGRHL